MTVWRRASSLAVLFVLLGVWRPQLEPVEAQSAVPSRPWTCWSVPATGGPFATLAFSDRVCGIFVQDAARIQLRPPSAQRGPIVVPAAPAGLTATVSGQTVSLSWTPTGDAETTYVLEVGSASGRADLANAVTGSPAPSLEATGVPPGRYFMRVRARNANAASAASNEVVATVTVQGAVCASVSDAPAALTSSVNGSSVTLTWAAPSSGCTPASYVIEAGATSGTSNLANFSTGSSVTTFSASGVPSGVYYVRVRSATSAGVSSASNEAVVAIGACTAAPPAPAVLASSVGGSTVVLTWTPSAGVVSSYILDAGSASGLSNVVVSDTGSSATSLTATGVPTASYYVRVRARNACGTSGASMENLVVVPGTTGTGLLAGATTFAGPYPTPAEVTYTDLAGESASLIAYPGQVQVFVSGISQASVESAIQAAGGLVLGRVPVLGYYLAGVAPGGEPAFITAIGRVSGVIDVHPNQTGIRATAVSAGAAAVVGAATAPGATIFETCTDTDTHYRDVKNALVGNGGVFKKCRDIGFDLSSTVHAILAEGNENGTAPTLINLSTFGTTTDTNGRFINGGNYDTYPTAIKQKLMRTWKNYLTAVLNAVAALPPEYRANFVLTICSGNNNMPITAAMADLRKNSRFAAILSKNVLVVSTTLMKGNYSTTDSDVVFCDNPQAGSGTSFAAPGCLAYIQNAMAATGATPEIALQALKLAAATNADHKAKPSEVIDKAQAIIAAHATDPGGASSVTSIVLTTPGASTSATITPAMANVSVQYTVSGTDGYYDSGTLRTNSSGRVTFSIPAGENGVTDTISVVALASGKSATTKYTWH